MTEPIDQRALEALRRDREATAPDDARARIASRLALSLTRPEPPSRAPSDAGAAASGAHSTGLVALAFVLGGGVGALLHAGLARTAAPQMIDVERSAPSISSAAPSPPSPPASAPSTEGSAVPVGPPTGAGSKPAPYTGVPQLDAERALLDSARAALVSGESATALAALDRHARAYARPMLGEERDALFVQALVRAGRYDEARTRADAFRHHTPNSLFLPAVDNAIGSIP